jgi:hypothetical protein
MDICKYLRTPQKMWIARLADICTDMERPHILYLSNEMNTYIILSASMDINLHPTLAI